MFRRHHIVTSILTALVLAAPALAADSYQPGATVLVSRSDGFGPLPAQGDGDSWATDHAISANGRYTVFTSNADDLGAPDVNVNHTYVRDDQTGAVTVVDRAGPGGPLGNNRSDEPAISADGSKVCFMSWANNLVPGVGEHHVYVVTVATGAIAVADRATGGALATGYAEHCALDADGGIAVFDSTANNLGANDGRTHVYARHLAANTTQVVDSAAGTAGDGGAYDPVIDAAGATVAFRSYASNLNGPGGDTNAKADVYARGLNVAQPVLVSRAAGAGGAIGDGNSGEPSISSDGNVVAFSSEAKNFNDGDNDAQVDVHVRNIGAATTTLVSRADGAGAKGNGDSYAPAIAGDGSAVAFISRSTNFGADPGKNDEGQNSLGYVRTLGAAHTTIITRASGADGAIDQGYYNVVAIDQHATNATFTSAAAHLDPLADGAFSELFQRHLAGALETRLVSRPADASSRPAEIGDVDRSHRSVSADGRYVVFAAVASFGPTGVKEVWLRDVLLGTTRLVSRADGADGAPGDRESSDAAISADGTKVAFESYARNLPGGPGDAERQIYVRDLVANTTVLASTGPAGPGTYGAGQPTLNQDGTKVAFESYSPNLVAGDANGTTDVFVRDLTSGTTTLVSTTAGGGQPDARSSYAMISADGSRVGFTSDAKNMGFGGPNDGSQHLYVRDLAAGSTELVDRYADGSPSDKSTDRVDMSADGNRFVFDSAAKLTPDATNSSSDVFVRDVAAGTTNLAGIGPNGEHGTKQMFPQAISMDGRKIVFATYADAFGTNEPASGWIRDLAAGTTSLVGVRDGTQTPADDSIQGVSMDADGNCVVFEANDSKLASPSYAGHDNSQLWMHVVGGECPVHAPDTTLTSGPDGKAKVRQTYSVFGYQADESGATFTCSLDDAPMKPCGDAFHTGALRDGVHRFKVAAQDRAGNTDPTPALVTFTVGVPPRVTKLRMDKRGRLVFKLSEKAKVRVRLTRAGRAHSAAVGKLTIKRSFKKGTRRVKLPTQRLRSGHYHATVTATDAGGNRSVPKRKSFDVRR